MAIEIKMDDCEIRNRLDSLGSTGSHLGQHRLLKPSPGTPVLEFVKDFYDDLFRTSESNGIIPASVSKFGDAESGFSATPQTASNPMNGGIVFGLPREM